MVSKRPVIVHLATISFALDSTLRHASGRDGSYKIRDLRFSPDASELITAETDGKIHVSNLDSLIR